MKKLKITIATILFFVLSCLSVGTTVAKYMKTISAGTFNFTIEKSVVETFIRVAENGVPDETGKYILFGKYPQKKVDDTTSSTLNGAYATELPTNGNNGDWTSYKYYQGNGVSNQDANIKNDVDFMWYKDVTHKGKKYRGVYFTSYRPKFTYKPSLTGIDVDKYGKVNPIGSTNTLQYHHGYYINTVYWFEYDWIKWEIMKENNDGTVMIFAENAIDSRCFYARPGTRTMNGSTVYATNYEHSDIREWLNNDFYNVAFETEQKTLITNTLVDNSKKDGSGAYPNQTTYACDDTNDDVFLLSWDEVENVFKLTVEEKLTAEGKSIKNVSDYALSQGVLADDTDSDPDNIRECHWLTRTPRNSGGSIAVLTGGAGGMSGNFSGFTSNSGAMGICPALTMKLE